MKYMPVLMVTIACLLGACNRAPSLASSRTEAAMPMRESMTLCLADASTDAALDDQLRSAQRAVQHAPGNAERWVEAGRQWLHKARSSSDAGFYLNVDGCVEEALALAADSPAALALRGLVLMNRHDFEGARALSERLIERDADDAVALGTLSDALLELGDYPNALAAAQRQMAARPGMAAHARGAYLSWLHGDSVRAKLLIRDALQDRSSADPEAAAWTFVEAARMFWHEGDLSGADALLVEALRWVDDYPAALVLRARIALAENAPQRGIDYLLRAHQQSALVESAWLLSDAYDELHNARAAQQWFDTAQRLGTQTDRLTLGLMLAVRDLEPARAVQWLEAERRVRGGIQLDDAYAWALYRAGRIDEAARYSAQALRLGTPDSRLLYHGGAIRIAQGRAIEGRTLIERALALNAGFDLREARQARAALAATVALANR